MIPWEEFQKKFEDRFKHSFNIYKVLHRIREYTFIDYFIKRKKKINFTYGGLKYIRFSEIEQECSVPIRFVANLATTSLEIEESNNIKLFYLAILICDINKKERDFICNNSTLRNIVTDSWCHDRVNYDDLGIAADYLTDKCPLRAEFLRYFIETKRCPYKIACYLDLFCSGKTTPESLRPKMCIVSHIRGMNFWELMARAMIFYEITKLLPWEVNNDYCVD